eukprot:4523375-Prymnesium_polylepis.1
MELCVRGGCGSTSRPDVPPPFSCGLRRNCGRDRWRHNIDRCKSAQDDSSLARYGASWRCPHNCAAWARHSQAYTTTRTWHRRGRAAWGCSIGLRHRGRELRRAEPCARAGSKRWQQPSVALAAPGGVLVCNWG